MTSIKLQTESQQNALLNVDTHWLSVQTLLMAP